MNESFINGILEFSKKPSIAYNEVFNDIALRDTIEPHLLPIMTRYFKDKFVTRFLEGMFSNTNLEDVNRTSLPTYIFLPSKFSDVHSFEFEGHQTIVGSLRDFHKETSALADGLGLVRDQRDNYPGGKQKIGFKLLDISWSSIQSELPLVIY